MTARAAAPAIAAIAIAAATACSGAPSPPPDPPAGPAGDITVFAASSLAAVFTTLSGQLEKAHPGTRVKFSFAGSTDLLTQLTQGAPADVFASADEASMGRAVGAGLMRGAPEVFATNTLTIITRPGNPHGVADFADLARPGLAVVVCAPQVPCGAAAAKLGRLTGVTLTPASEESTVTDVVGKVISGAADAGLVYLTDARAAGDKVTEVTIPLADAASNSYPVGVLAESRNPSAAESFVELLTGPTGRGALADAGFEIP